MFRAKHKQQKHARIVSNTKFSNIQDAENIRKKSTTNTTKLEKITETVWELMTKAVREHRYRLPRPTLQLELSTRVIHPARHITSASPDKHQVERA